MSLRWIHDVFGNSVAIATFDERAETLTFTATATVEHNPAEEFALTPDDPAYFYPFLYDDEEFPDLQQFITPQYGDPERRTVGMGAAISRCRRADADLQYSQRHDPRHPRGLQSIASGTSTARSIRSTRCRPDPAPAATMRCS